MKRFHVFLQLVAVLFFASESALAHGSLGRAKETDLAAMAETANLVVIANIQDVKYVNVPIKGEDHTIPNGLVTISILKTLRGKAPGKTMTLRFLGGSDGLGGILGVNGVPMFEAGEINLLFITGNGNAACPLANCEWGRFRVLKDAVYNTHGSPVLSVSNGHVVAHGVPPKELTTIHFPAPTFDAVMQNPVIKERFSQMGMTYEEGKARYEREAPKFIEYGLNVPTALETGEPINEPIPPEIKGEMKTPLDGQNAQAPSVNKNLSSYRRAPVKAASGPMSLKSFTDEITKIIGAVKRTPLGVESIDPSADYQLPAIQPLEAPALPDDKPVLQVDPKTQSEADDPLQGAGLEQKGAVVNPNQQPAIKLPDGKKTDGKTQPKN